MLTRTQLDAALVARVGSLMEWAGLSTAITPGQPLASTNEAIASALEELGVNPADRSLVTTEDLARFADAMQGQVVDLAEIRVVEACESRGAGQPLRRRWDDYEEDFGRYTSASLSATLARKRADYRSRYGGRVSAGLRPSAVTHPLDTSTFFAG